MMRKTVNIWSFIFEIWPWEDNRNVESVCIIIN